MIKLENLTKIYNSSESVGIGVQNINLELHVGEFVAIVGASGSGKTTLLNIITGMDVHTEGEMFINDYSTSNFTMEDYENYRRGNVSFIFQNYQLIDSYTVLENVMVELILKGMPKKEAKKHAKELLSQVGMIHRLNHRAIKLSGGEKQRVVIARALASDTKILACDEPTGNLDSKNTQEIMSIIKKVSKEKLVLFVTHDESLIQGNATRVVKIRDGRIESDTKLLETETYTEELSIPQKNNWKTRFYIAMKNLIRAPKKSIFLLLTFLILAFAILFSIAYIPLDMIATDSTLIEYTSFNNRDPNRIIVYSNDEFDGNYGVDSNQIYEQDFVLDYSFTTLTTSNYLKNVLQKNSYVRLTKSDLNLIVGRFPNDERKSEAVLILKDGYSAESLESEIGKLVRFNFKNSIAAFSEYYTIVGFATSPNLKDDHNDIYLGRAGAENFINTLLSTFQNRNIFTTFQDDFYLMYEGKKYTAKINPNITPIRLESGEYIDPIRINMKYQNKDISILFGNKSIDLNTYGTYYYYSFTQDYDVEISPSLAFKILEENIYRVSIYAEDAEINSVIKTLKANPNLEVYPQRDAVRVLPKYDFMGIFKNLFYFVFIIVEVIVSLFIVSLITSLILKTKKKDLGVLRVMGLSQSDVLHVLHLELLTTMIFSILLNIIIAVCFKFFEVKISYAIIFNNFGKLIFSIVLLLIMALLISYRWNKKMFKKTAREVLKAGDIQ